MVWEVMSVSNIQLKFFHLNIIAMTFYNDIMPDLNELMYAYGCHFSILLSPLKNRTPPNFTIVNFGHPVSKS